MEFHHLGSHCSYPDCKQLDFLPFKCNACGDTFCLEHRTYEAHHCKAADNADRRALVCPICNTPIVPLPSQDPNIVLDDHINQGCAVKQSAGYKCNMKGCKKVDVIPIICKSCRRHHCVRHRYEDAHNCTRDPKLAKKNNQNKTTNNNTNIKQTNSPPTNTNSNIYPGTNSNTSNNNRPSNSHQNTNSRPQNSPQAPSYTTNSTETTIGVRLTNGELIRRTCSSTYTLRDIQLFIDQTRTDGSAPYVMRTTYPPRELSYYDLDKTLAQLGLVPSGMIILQPLQLEGQPNNITTPANNNENTTNNTINNSNTPNVGWWGLVSSFFGSILPSSNNNTM